MKCNIEVIEFEFFVDIGMSIHARVAHKLLFLIDPVWLVPFFNLINET